MKKKDFISLKEVKLLVNACDGMHRGIMNAAFIAVAYGASLKLDDILDLRVNDYDNGFINCKGTKIKLIGGLEAKIEAWIRHRSYFNIKGCLMFCSLNKRYAGGSLNEFRHDLPKIAKKAGINKRVHSLSLRDSSILYRFLINKEDLDFLTIVGNFRDKDTLSNRIKEMIGELKRTNCMEFNKILRKQ